ncbi:NUDIX domain-containing protein [Streptomyces sp. I4(2020)]|nr:NUDIX domain-containing protein [Streptomyces sp. I3(2020)]MBJ6627042.1 NUDIX domain-containing protein [Streptomyces sp. I4(2020)]
MATTADNKEPARVRLHPGNLQHALEVAERPAAVRRADNGTWEPLGGVLELDERREDGAVREVLEETGICVSVERLTGVYKNMTRGVAALVFRCRPVEGVERTSSESTAVEWLTPDEVVKRMSEVYAVRVLDALEAATVPHVRAHHGRRLLASA